jgi:hypothetical protein
MFLWSILVAVLAAIVGMLFVIGFSSVGRAATAIKCGFDDDYQEFPKGPVLIKQKCDGAPTTLQKGLFTNPNGTVTPGTPGAGTPGARTTGTASPNRTGTPAAAGAGTPAAGECKGDPKLALAVGKPVTLLAEAIRRSTPGTSGQRLPDLGGGRAGGISGGPQCLDGLVWWEVDVNGSKAWTAEQDQNGVRLILDR